MYILGISCFYHDSAAALINNGQLVAAAAEERFSRVKHDNGFPKQAIQFCLSFAGITGDELEYVVFYEKPLLKIERILLTNLNTFPRSANSWREGVFGWFSEKLWVKATIHREIGIAYDRILFCEHHMSHAASAFFCSPFQEAAVLTVDGVGEWTTTALGIATSRWEGMKGGVNSINLFHEQRFPHSIGLLYSVFTAYLGFQVNDGEYKVMGLASYGEPLYVDKIRQVFRQEADGSFLLNMDYFSFHQSMHCPYNQRFIDLFGEPRSPEREFFTRETNPERSTEMHSIAENQRFADIAASIQQITEDSLIVIAQYLYQKTRCTKLVMAGGVALNSKANYRIQCETLFDDVYVHPAAGDDGGALGAALWVYYVVLNEPRNWVLPHAYWGQEYTDSECRVFLDGVGASYKSYENSDNLLFDVMVKALMETKVVGFFQGRFEWGPRALGNRSILADPRDAIMKERVNTRIKFRETFRPFAPVVITEQADEYFDLSEVRKSEMLRYMLMVVPVLGDKQQEIAAVTHCGTARVQVVGYEENSRYYGVIKRFGDVSGVPVLLNTSFNLRREPIVSSLADAWQVFLKSELDLLVLGSCVVRRSV